MVFRFDAFEVDEERFELRRDGVAVSVQPRVFDLLLFLVRRPDAVHMRAHLLAEVWSGVRVTDDALAQAMMALRKALSDTGETPRFIETVRGRGYRFIAQVTAGAAQLVESIAPPPPARAGDASSFVAHGVGLAQVVERLGAGGGVVLVTGDAGSGKTRFLELLAARTTTAVVARGAPTGAPDLWLFTQILRELRKRGVALEGTLAAIADGSHDPAAFENPASRFKLADALLAVLARAAAGSPLLIAADDIDGESPHTLAVLELVAMRLRETTVVLCATHTRKSNPSAALQSFLAACSRDPGVMVTPLEPLSRREVAGFLEATAGAAPSPALLDKVHHKTGGNARLLAQLAQRPKADWARETSMTTGSLVDVAPLHDAIAYQLRSLPADVLTVVTMAAVLGASFVVAPLSAALGLSSGDTVRALDAATGARVLTRGGAGQYRFAYPLVRDVLHEQLSATERARLHGLVARALEAHLADSTDHVQVAALAAHFVEAAATGDVDAAIDWSLRAADLAAAAGDHDAARSAAARGLAAIELAPVPDVAKRARLRARVGTG